LAPADLDRFRRVGGEFAKMERLYRDDAGFERDLGVVHLLDGQHDLAAQSLEVSLGLEPDRPSARFLLAIARIGQRRFDDARALLLQVPASDPFYRTAQERLKTLAPR
jgi:Flp pilus assembly protein TadD